MNKDRFSLVELSPDISLGIGQTRDQVEDGLIGVAVISKGAIHVFNIDYKTGIIQLNKFAEVISELTEKA